MVELQSNIIMHKLLYNGNKLRILELHVHVCIFYFFINWGKNSKLVGLW